MKRLFLLMFLVTGLGAGVAAASADTVAPIATSGPITFELPKYATGSVNGQNGWQKTGLYDVEVAKVADFAAARDYGFGKQALRISDAVVSGAFADQTYSPALVSPAGEGAAATHFEASFRIGTTKAIEQPGLHLTVSPDSGDGSRMSYLRFEDRADGVHVFFVDASDPGPLGHEATFNEKDIATLDRAHSHLIRFLINFRPGPANDVVRILVDGVQKASGTTWEDYYRYDKEQAGGGNVVPTVSKLLFAVRGDSNNLADNGQGFLVDGVSLFSLGDARSATR
jgi:hypothetical protein